MLCSFWLRRRSIRCCRPSCPVARYTTFRVSRLPIWWSIWNTYLPAKGVTAEPEALNVIAQKADGGMRDALSIFDQVVSFTNGNITYQAVIDNLNVLDYEYYFRLTDAMLSGNVRSAILILNDILSTGFDGQNIITGLASHFRDLLVCKDEATLILFEVGASYP